MLTYADPTLPHNIIFCCRISLPLVLFLRRVSVTATFLFSKGVVSRVASILADQESPCFSPQKQPSLPATKIIEVIACDIPLALNRREEKRGSREKKGDETREKKEKNRKRKN